MTTLPEERASHRAWIIPLAFAIAGAWSWACAEPPDLDPGNSGGATATGASSASAEATGDASGNGPDASGGPTNIEPRDVLRSIAYSVIVPSTAEFSRLAGELQTTVDAYAVAVEANPVDAGVELAAAKDGWSLAMAQWQQLEVMQIGPAAPSVSAIAGENIRDEVYSWPTIDTCTVDRRIVDQRYLEEDFFLTENVFAYGLDALEYLLFVHDLGHTCAAQVQLDGPWTGLGYEEIERRRGAYAARVAAEIARRGNELATRWSPDGDDFAALLTNPGGDSPFESESVALDDVFRAMFYIDLLTKDAKLARALGLASGCEAAPCPDLLEAPFGGMAAASVAANLRGIAQMIHGGPDASGDGFDDLLIAAGRGEVATDLLADIEAAIAQAETFDQPLQQIIVSDIAQVEALHAAVKNVTDTLKGPFVMALMLALPAEGASDND